MSTPNDRAVLSAILNPLMPQVPEEEDRTADDDETELSPAESAARELEVVGVKAAEGGRLKEAMAAFHAAVAACPGRASCYNNRAQAHRIGGDVEAALSDLDAAVRLSGGQGKAACQAFTQRAQIWRLRKEDEKAKADFEKAAALGSAFAQTQLVAMNPYAAMCNKMLADVIGKLQRGQPEDQPDPGDAA